jgi:hypothetical protein
VSFGRTPHIVIFRKKQFNRREAREPLYGAILKEDKRRRDWERACKAEDILVVEQRARFAIDGSTHLK